MKTFSCFYHGDFPLKSGQPISGNDILSRWFSEEDEDECERDEIHQRKGEVFQKNESEKDECDEAYPVDDAFFYPALVPCISDVEKQVDQWEAKGKYI